nr:MAG TPA: hypothetical protein [Bacteriophage sp.]
MPPTIVLCSFSSPRVTSSLTMFRAPFSLRPVQSARYPYPPL